MTEASGKPAIDTTVAKLFNAYDIRGVVPDELTPEIAYRIGRALVVSLQPEEVAVGRDMRVSSPALAASLIEGIRDQGANVADVGLISTDGLYFAVGTYGYPAGVMITASHNPARYNGFKICRDDAKALSLDEGLAEIRDLVLTNDFPQPAGGRRGDLQARDVLDAYADYVLSLVDPTRIRPLKIAVDAGNGMAGLTVPKVFDRLPCEIVPLFFELDGTFPNHEANPLEPQNIKDLQKAVLEHSCDLGVAFDGDADRMFLIDERGQFVGGDMVTAMVSVSMLKKHPAAAIVYNLICSHAVPETIERLGGRPVRARVGHSIIKALMRREDAVFGGEHSGHFYFRDNWYADSGLIALLTVLELVSESDQTLSEVLRPLDTYVRSGEINTEVPDPAATVALVEAEFRAKGAKIDKLDGLTAELGDWWFNLRASNTQPLLRLNVEANDPETLHRATKEVLTLMQPAPTNQSSGGA